MFITFGKHLKKLPVLFTYIVHQFPTKMDVGKTLETPLKLN